MDKKLYSWKEIVELNTSGGIINTNKIHKFKNAKFCIKKIDVREIPIYSYLTIHQYEKLGMLEEVQIIKSFMKDYKNNNVPLMILDKDYNIIDGSHRVGALIELKIYRIKAFVMC